MPIFPKLKKKNIFEETYLTRAGYKILLSQYTMKHYQNIILSLGFKNKIRYWDLENFAPLRGL